MRNVILAIGAGITAVTIGIAMFKPAPPSIRIAILPFTPYSSDAKDQMIADQLTQKVTAEFVKLGTFDVVPSTSARRYEDRRPGVREIAASLQADILLEARTSTEGGAVKVESRLSDGALDRKFWVSEKTSSYNVDLLAKQIALAANAAAAKKKSSP